MSRRSSRRSSRWRRTRAGTRLPLELIVRANLSLSDQPLGDDRLDFTGSAEQLTADIAATRDLGASELIMDAAFDQGVKSVEDFLRRMEL